MEIKSLSREEFLQTIYRIWGEYFNLSPEIFFSVGTTVVVMERNMPATISQYAIGKHMILISSNELQEQTQALVKKHGDSEVLNFVVFESDWGAGTVSYNGKADICYLYPSDFVPYTTENYVIRQLSLTDETALNSLKSACTPDEVDEGEVSVVDKIGYGAYDGDKMVACGTMYDWHGFADIGVLVHPDYRQRGLGKAVVSPLCEWIINQGRIAIYRYDVNNIGSKGIANRLGFEPYFSIESFDVINQ